MAVRDIASSAVSRGQGRDRAPPLLERGGYRVPMAARGRALLLLERRYRDQMADIILPPPPEFRDPEPGALPHTQPEGTPPGGDKPAEDDFSQSLQNLFKEPETFHVFQTDFHEWLRVWRMNSNPNDPERKDVRGFLENRMRLNARNVFQSEVDELGGVKASFGLEVYFKKTTKSGKVLIRDRHYFKEDNFREIFERRFDEFVDKVVGRN